MHVNLYYNAARKYLRGPHTHKSDSTYTATCECESVYNRFAFNCCNEWHKLIEIYVRASQCKHIMHIHKHRYLCEYTSNNYVILYTHTRISSAKSAVLIFFYAQTLVNAGSCA